jgi:cation:H+ antiporter
MDVAINLVIGLVLLAVGAEATLRGALSVARKLGLSELLIGLTLMGFGTSTPELLTSVQSALVGSPGIAIGNVVGSNIANILVILGVAVIVRPIIVDPRSVTRDGAVVVAVSVLLVAIAIAFGGFARPVGFAFLALLALYIFVVWRMEKAPPDVVAQVGGPLVEQPKTDPLALSLGLAAIGITLLIFGADFLVKGAIDLARMAGLSETVIGLTIVAIGTSLPELVASTVAAARGKSDLAIGNVLGSNIYNILGILGVTAAIQPLQVPPDMGMRDWTILIGTAIVLFGLGLRGRIGRLEGLLLLAGYGAYCWMLTHPVG